jgi:hypothetical protein
MISRDTINSHKANVMTVARVFTARITKAYDKFHGGLVGAGLGGLKPDDTMVV